MAFDLNAISAFVATITSNLAANFEKIYKTLDGRQFKKFVSNAGADRVVELVHPRLKPNHQLDVVSSSLLMGK